MSNCGRVFQVVNVELVSFMWHKKVSLEISGKSFSQQVLRACYLTGMILVAERFSSEENPCLHGADVWLGERRPAKEIKECDVGMWGPLVRTSCYFREGT